MADWYRRNIKYERRRYGSISNCTYDKWNDYDYDIGLSKLTIIIENNEDPPKDWTITRNHAEQYENNEKPRKNCTITRSHEQIRT